MISVGVYIFLVLECAMKLYISFKDMRKKEVYSILYDDESL